jgi:hypothetical protein
MHVAVDPKNLMIGSSTSDGMAFANVGGEQQPPQDNSQMQCCNCQEMGHCASTGDNAWRAQASGAQAFMSGVEFTEPARRRRHLIQFFERLRWLEVQ